MDIMVEQDQFSLDWEKSTTECGWKEFRAWFETALNDGYQYDDSASDAPSGYPRIRVKTGLPQLLVIGVCYGSSLRFGEVRPDGEFRALWYCAPTLEKFYEFLNNLRIAEHQYAGGCYRFGAPAWEVA
jgi:hypothetical protein